MKPVKIKSITAEDTLRVYRNREGEVHLLMEVNGNMGRYYHAQWWEWQEDSIVKGLGNEFWQWISPRFSETPEPFSGITDADIYRIARSNKGHLYWLFVPMGEEGMWCKIQPLTDSNDGTLHEETDAGGFICVEKNPYERMIEWLTPPIPPQFFQPVIRKPKPFKP